MTLAPDMRSHTTRRRFTLLLIGMLAIAVIGAVALRGGKADASAPDVFVGTAHVTFPGSPGYGPYDIPAGALIGGSGSTITDTLFSSIEGPFDGAFFLDTLDGWTFQHPFANYGFGTLTQPCPCNMIQGPPSPTTLRNMNANTKIRVVMYNNQQNVLIQVEGTSGTKNFAITFTGTSCSFSFTLDCIGGSS